MADREIQQEAERMEEEKKLKRKREATKNEIMAFNERRKQDKEEAEEKHRHLVKEVKKIAEEEIKKGKKRLKNSCHGNNHNACPMERSTMESSLQWRIMQLLMFIFFSLYSFSGLSTENNC